MVVRNFETIFDFCMIHMAVVEKSTLGLLFSTGNLCNFSPVKIIFLYSVTTRSTGMESLSFNLHYVFLDLQMHIFH